MRLEDLRVRLPENPDPNERYFTCPANVADLLDALIAEGGETIWWCETHEAGGNDECWYADFVFIESGSLPLIPCRMVERLLVPVESPEVPT